MSATVITELYFLWCELSRRKLSPMLATAHHSFPHNAIGLVAQCELSGYVKLEAVGLKFSHRPRQSCHSWSSKMAVLWRHCGL